MQAHRIVAAAMAVLITSAAGCPLPAQAQSARDFVGGLAGGMLGGVIAGAMMANARPRQVVVYQPRGYRRHAIRHYAAAPRHRQPASAGSRNTATIDTASDPFATAKPMTPFPVSAKP